MVWDTGFVVFVADDLAAWLISLLADRGRKGLATVLLGSEQERALRSAASTAVRQTAQELCPDDDEQAEHVALVISQVFGKPIPRAALAKHPTMLEALQAGIAAQLAVLDDPSLTGTGLSSSDLLELPDVVLAEKVTAHLLREILVRGSREGALFPLASQLNHDQSRLDNQQLKSMISDLARPEGAHPVAPPTALAPPSAYLEQVRRIAPQDPPGLLGRETELAELARFCLEPDRGPYVWWRADALYGKSALLSTFVLRPPSDVSQQVRIVSFFITARLAGQDTREAFTQVLLEQLADLLGQPLPPALPEATREAHLLSLLRQAATACQDGGRRLVLVVDGLDEDRGAGPDAHSIAALLPASPPAGMRVVVAGRPDPPIPDDVPGGHPLRDPGIVRPLARSPHAKEIGQLARTELARLLRGGEPGRQLLGLLAAARGGLSAADLEELTDIPLWEIDEILNGVSGRTFSRRAGQSATGAASELYLLGHQSLQDAAVQTFGRRLADYRAKLEAWAASYHARRWPPGTPEYLLSGYFNLLDEVGDVSRMTEYATDLARHDRMLDLTGGDAAAIEEVRATLKRITACESPDLGSALMLAWHRDHLTERNDNTPVALPAVWANLGHQRRAEALAASPADPRRRAESLARVAESLAETREADLAAAAGWKAETAAQSIADPSEAVPVLARAATALAAAGQVNEATDIANSIIGRYGAAEALAKIAAALARAGYREHADAVAGQAQVSAVSDNQARWQALHLIEVSKALAEGGLHEHAVTAARKALTVAEANHDWDHKNPAVTEIARTLAAMGQLEQAVDEARSFYHASDQATALAKVAEVLAQTKRHEQAVATAQLARDMAQSVPDPSRKAMTLSRIAKTLTGAGLYEQAIGVAGEAEAAAGLTTVPIWKAQALAAGAAALAASGQSELAVAKAREAQGLILSLAEDWQRLLLDEVARTFAATGRPKEATAAAEAITNDSGRAYALHAVAITLADAGRHEQAITTARSISKEDVRADALTRVAVALAVAGQLGEAEETVEWISKPSERASALAEVAEALVRVGRREEAMITAGHAEATARAITNPRRQRDALVAIAGALADADEPEHAEAVAQLIADPVFKELKLDGAAASYARAGRADEAEATARSITDPKRQAQALMWVAAALAGAGSHERAEAIAWSIPDPGTQGGALLKVAAAMARAGRYEPAEVIAQSVSDPSRRAYAVMWVAEAAPEAGKHETAKAAARSIADPAMRDSALARVVVALARRGNHEEAEPIARSIIDPDARSYALTQVATVLVTAGQPARAADAASEAEAAAGLIDGLSQRAAALVRVAEAFERAGLHAQADAAVNRAEAVARSITEPDEQDDALASATTELVRVGQYERAEAMARSIASPVRQKWAIGEVAVALVAAGHHEQAETTARSIADVSDQNTALWSVAAELARVGCSEQAMTVVRSITDPAQRSQARAWVAEILLKAGDVVSARRLAAEACLAGTWEAAARPVLLVDPSAFNALAPMLQP